MKHLSIESYFKKQSISFDEYNNLTPGTIDYIWGDTSDHTKIKFLTCLIKNKFCNSKILEIGT